MTPDIGISSPPTNKEKKERYNTHMHTQACMDMKVTPLVMQHGSRDHVCPMLCSFSHEMYVISAEINC